jgi:tetratricopeptide (TPR) repeat protein
MSLTAHCTLPNAGDCRPADVNPRARPTDSDHLDRLCARLLEILQSKSDQVISGSTEPGRLAALREEFAGRIRGAAQELAAKLRQELRCWTAAVEHSHQLAQCRYLPLAGSLAAFPLELARAAREAQHVVEALEALSDHRPTYFDSVPVQAAELGLGVSASHESERSEERFPESLQIPAPPVLEDDPSPVDEAAREEREPTLNNLAGFSSKEPGESPNSPAVQSLFARAESCRRAKHYDRAVGLYGEVLQRARGHRIAYVRRGQLHLLQKRPEPAIVDLSAALRLDDRNAEALLSRGDAYAVIGRIEEAVADYTLSLALDPEQIRARFNRAIAYRLQGQLAEALVQFTEVIKAQPNHDAAHYHRGLVHVALELYDQAIADFTQTVRLNPGHAQARAKLRQTRKVMRDQAAAYRQPDRRNGGSAGKITVASEDTVVRVECPDCKTRGAIRWDKLGNLHICRHCSRSYRVAASGGLVEVMRTNISKWIDKSAQAARWRRGRWSHLVVRRLLPALGLAATVLIAVWLASHPAASSAEQLPRELNLRAELFTRAWLKKDWALMRQLVRPGDDRNLYRWAVRQSPPELSPRRTQESQSWPIEATVLSNQPQSATVRIRMPGLHGKSGGDLEMQQTWEQRSGTWFFVVPDQPRTR